MVNEDEKGSFSMTKWGKRWFLLPILGIMLACSFPSLARSAASTPSGVPVYTVTPFMPGDAPAQGEEDYPATPEGVVQAFLNAYQEQPDQMGQYLRQAQQASEEDKANLLQIEGDIDGFAIQSAAVSVDPPGAVIVVAIQTGGTEALRRFSLTRQNEKWVIDIIETRVDG